MVGNRGYFIEPTVLAKANRGMKVVREEMFGPMVCVQPFEKDDPDRIATFANDTEYGLAASIWTRDLRKTGGLARKIKAGTVRGITHNRGGPAMPFEGYKQSGWGRAAAAGVPCASAPDRDRGQQPPSEDGRIGRTRWPVVRPT